MATADDLLDELIKNCKQHVELVGNIGFLNQLSRMSLHQPEQPSETEQMDSHAVEERQ